MVPFGLNSPMIFPNGFIFLFFFFFFLGGGGFKEGSMDQVCGEEGSMGGGSVHVLSSTVSQLG